MMSSVYLILLFGVLASAREWSSDLVLPTFHNINNCVNMPSEMDRRFEETFYTQLIPYTAIGTSGYVYGLQFCSSVLNEFVRIEIWREQTCTSGMCYRLIGYTEVTRTFIGVNYAYFERPISVLFTDVLGISYRDSNPIPYSTFTGCSHSPDHMIRYDGFVEDTSQILPFEYDANDFQCRQYSLEVFVESLDVSNDCEIHQAVEDDVPYSLFSHDTYSNSDYTNNFERCWKIRASQPDRVIVFDTVDFDVEFHASCTFDQIRFYVYTSDITAVETCYHDNCQGFCGAYGNSAPQNGIERWVILHDRVKMEFTTDADRTRGGFYLQFRSVDPALHPDIESGVLNGDPSLTTTSTTESSAQAGASSDKQNKDRFWRDWEDWQRAVAVLAIIAGAVLFVVVVVLLCVYCCDRDEDSGKSGSKVAVEEPRVVLAEKEYSTETKPHRFVNVYSSSLPMSKMEHTPTYSEYPNAYEYIHDNASVTSNNDYDVTQNGSHMWHSTLGHNGVQSPPIDSGFNRNHPLSRSSSIATKTTVMSAPRALKTNRDPFGHRSSTGS